MTAPGATPGRSLAVTAGGTLLAMTAFTAPLSIVPSVGADLGAGPVGTAWILSSMSLGLAVALLTSGAIGDAVGRRRVFVAGAVLTAVGSALSGLAPTTALFVAGRVVQGLGAAALMACGLALISATFAPGPPRARATGVWGAAMGAGPAVGPLLGSVGDAVSSWRWAYLVLTLLSAGIAVAGQRWLAESRGDAARRIDVVGALLLGAGLGCLLAALTEGRQGWTQPFVAVLGAAAVVLLVAVGMHLRRTAEPLFPPSLFRRPALVGATLAAFATGGGIIALMSFIGTVLERGMAHSAVAASTILLAWSLLSVGASLASRWLPAGLSGGARLSLGLAVIAVGIVPLALLGPAGGLWALIPGLVVSGAGTGLANATLGREAVAAVPPERAATGSGINNAARYVGAAFGVTGVTVLAIRPDSPDPVASLLSGWNVAVMCGIVVCVLAAVAVPLLQRADDRRLTRAVAPAP
ncbi:MFS transporter [Pseudonocardia sp. N23]|uniref:MFS transporter n=1 Tax=Pseudonocardia sp. N23 TaxID=1987376 RepID=UPI000BFC5B84|nr:MFS transporter [Pseudonocardia sp. N23]GAY08278.1 putative transmembrane efflux protein [Pseudonocardia sp. N23]